MTEQEWLQCTDPNPILHFLRGKAVDRKFRLFCVACCRRIWPLLTHGRSRAMVDVLERFADGESDQAAVKVVEKAAAKARDLSPSRAARAACEAARDSWKTAWAAARAVKIHWGEARWVAESKAQAAVIRDLLGPLPFRTLKADPSWLRWHGGLLVSMARRMYDSRDFADMPVLADALEEAGCRDADILGHCRSGGQHVRGCWVVDLVVGKR
jgi:hypothetical protein